MGALDAKRSIEKEYQFYFLSHSPTEKELSERVFYGGREALMGSFEFDLA